MFELALAIDRWPLKVPFRTATTCDTECETVTVTLKAEGATGRGEASGVYYLDETADSIAAQIERLRDQIERGISHADLAKMLSPGGARNALDCALWEWRSRHERRPVWVLAGLAAPQPVRTTVTIGAATPVAMASLAREWAVFDAIKIKLLGDDADAARVEAVRAARPDAWLAVDGNQGFDATSLAAIMPALVAARVALIEQPLRVGKDAVLDTIDAPIPFAADESVQTVGDLDTLPVAYRVINIKLDKTGGLTGALALADRARQQGRAVMVGNMVGTSLAMAPAWLVGQVATVVDLDGPLLLARDRDAAVGYTEGRIDCPPGVWGDEG